MSDNVASFKEKYLETQAINFVDRYEEGGEGMAASWARDNVAPTDFNDLRVYIQAEFTRRDYRIIPHE